MDEATVAVQLNRAELLVLTAVVKTVLRAKPDIACATELRTAGDKLCAVSYPDDLVEKTEPSGPTDEDLHEMRSSGY